MIIRRAATAVGFVARRRQPRMRLLDFRSMRKRKLLGFGRVAFPIGLTIHGVAVLLGRRGLFAALPSKAQIDGDGHQPRDANGKPAYTKVLERHDRDLNDRFPAGIVALVRQAHPDLADQWRDKTG
jgi:hypothetical protein